jgi:hypothetical protein
MGNSRLSGDSATADRIENDPAARTWSFVKDGPPLVFVAAAFVFLVVGELASSSPASGMAVLAVGLVLTLALEFAAWARRHPGDRHEAMATFATLGRRLEDARARRLERDRWR